MKKEKSREEPAITCPDGKQLLKCCTCVLIRNEFGVHWLRWPKQKMKL